MQRLAGEGMVFLEFDGHVVEYDLQPGQQIIVDTGYLAAMEGTCSMDIQTVPGVKNMLFGGEGIFNTVITGPGHIWLQTMPISNVAGAIAPFIPSTRRIYFPDCTGNLTHPCLVSQELSCTNTDFDSFPLNKPSAGICFHKTLKHMPADFS